MIVNEKSNAYVGRYQDLDIHPLVSIDPANRTG